MRHSQLNDHRTGHCTVTSSRRSGFTLIELGVSITILAILTAVTVTALNISQDRSRITSATRATRAMLEGARNRASLINQEQGFQPEARGLRLYLEYIDADNDGIYEVLCNTLQYVETPANDSAGTIEVQRPDEDPVTMPDNSGDGSAFADRPYILAGTNTNWQQRFNDGLLTSGSWIRLKDGWYKIDSIWFDGATTYLTITTEVASTNMDAYAAHPAVVAGSVITEDQEVTLSPQPMENEDPLTFEINTYIDLSQIKNNNKLPASWNNAVSTNLLYDDNLAYAVDDRILFEDLTGKINAYRCISATSGTPGIESPADTSFWTIIPAYVDIMFTPDGAISGSLSSHGMLHLPIVDLRDLENSLVLGEIEFKEGDERLVTIYTQSGQISTHAVSVTDAWYDNLIAYAVGERVIFTPNAATNPTLAYECILATTAGTDPTDASHWIQVPLKAYEQAETGVTEQ